MGSRADRIRQGKSVWISFTGVLEQTAVRWQGTVFGWVLTCSKVSGEIKADHLLNLLETKRKKNWFLWENITQPESTFDTEGIKQFWLLTEYSCQSRQTTSKKNLKKIKSTSSKKGTSYLWGEMTSIQWYFSDSIFDICPLPGSFLLHPKRLSDWAELSSLQCWTAKRNENTG